MSDYRLKVFLSSRTSAAGIIFSSAFRTLIVAELLLKGLILIF